MLTAIKRITGLGVFDGFTAPADLPSLGRFNVVYGENGAGKTTLSRLLSALPNGEHADHPDLEFVIETQSGQLTKGRQYARKVRVFNTDYVEANIGRFDGPIKHILILGEENKALAEELKKEMTTRDARLARIESLNAAATKQENDRGKIFSQIAKTIGEATSGSTLRSYRKPDAEAAFAKLTNAVELSDAQYKTHHATLRQDQMTEIGIPEMPKVAVPWGSELYPITEIAMYAGSRANMLTERSAQSAVIQRLAQNPDIATWVEKGVGLHAGHSSDRCEYCDQTIPTERVAALAAHFSTEDQTLKFDIDNERACIANSIEELDRLALPDKLALYGELRTDYDTALTTWRVERDALVVALTAIDTALAKKLTLRTSAYNDGLSVKTEPFSNSFNALVALIARHNKKTAGFEKEKVEARNAIEAHHLLSVKVSVDEAAAEIARLRAEVVLLRDGGAGLQDSRGVEELAQSITAKQAKVSNAHAGGENLTDHLKQFIGRTDLRFESGNDGYRVLRRGKPAKRLSEGEKTAIAFLYFIVQLKDQDFDLAEGVVVIDDPISSLDASAIYHAFSFLKNAVQDARQIFVLTHNFEFLRLLLNWVKNIPGVPKADKVYLMVLCSETAAGRSARLAPLDRLLIDHATEYHYLFKVLHTFKSDGTILGCYHIPNIARKVLETFLDFHVPSSKSLYQKLDETAFDPHKKTAIYKFANDLSHYTGKSFDPALVSEAQKNTEYLLEMIKAVAPLHYAGLEKLSA